MKTEKTVTKKKKPGLLRLIGKGILKGFGGIFCPGGSFSLLNTVLVLLIAALLVVGVRLGKTVHFSKMTIDQKLETGYATIDLQSSITASMDIGELSTSKLLYNGVYRKEKNNKNHDLEYGICYRATVKVGADMADLAFVVDDEQKTVTMQMPPLHIGDVEIDASSIDYIPDNVHFNMQKVLKDCEQDILQEASGNQELMNAANESMKTMVEALTGSLIDEAGYRLVWQEKISKPTVSGEEAEQ